MENPTRQRHTDSFLTEPERLAVREQLRRLFASSLFSRSKRYHDFLLYVVEETLQGRADALKERTIGAEVFKRDIHYDTNTDPIVRVAAAEIRKRIAQYYFDESHANELRIELHPGSYVPSFHVPVSSAFPEERRQALASGLDPARLATSSATHLEFSKAKEAFRSWPARATIAVVCAALLVSSAFLYRSKPSSSLPTQFWSSVAKSRGPVVFCLGVVSETNPRSGVLPSDVSAMARIQDSLRNIKTEYRVLDNPSAGMVELKSGPDVFVGPWHNKWVLSLTSSLRYKFGRDKGTRDVWIEDRQSPKRWVVHRALPPTVGSDDQRTETYGILARLRGTALGPHVVIVAGLTPQGTAAVEKVLSDPASLRTLVRQAPGDWQTMNLEAVIGTHLIDGKASSPKIEASYFWE